MVDSENLLKVFLEKATNLTRRRGKKEATRRKEKEKRPRTRIGEGSTVYGVSSET